MSTDSEYPAFVPSGENVRETARMLVEAADEHGISQRAIRATNGGFDITEELADVLGEADVEDLDEAGLDEQDGDEIPKSVPATQTNPQSRKGQGDSTAKTSGNRAAKNTSTTTNSEEE